MIRFEHVAFNVKDVHAAAEWYCTHLGFQVMRQQPVPPHMTFLADAGKHMMFEFYTNASVPLFDRASLNDTTTHVALMSDDLRADRARLLEAGCAASGDVATTPAGDLLAFLHCPHGLILQLVQRATPMLPLS